MKSNLFLPRNSYDVLIGIFSAAFWEKLNKTVVRKWSMEGTRFEGIDESLAREMVQHLPPGFGYIIKEIK